MYTMEKEDFGFRVRFGGHITTREMEQWLKESQQFMSEKKGRFKVFMDMTECQALPPEARDILEQIHTLYMENGLDRSVVVIDRLELDIQLPMKDACLETGAYIYCRYIDIKTTPDWHDKAMDWIIKAIEPYP